jgi:hypothetical protein
LSAADTLGRTLAFEALEIFELFFPSTTFEVFEVFDTFRVLVPFATLEDFDSAFLLEDLLTFEVRLLCWREILMI